MTTTPAGLRGQTEADAAPFVVRVPMTPPREVMPNSRTPRYSRPRQPGKAETTKWLRDAAYFATLGPILERGQRVPLFPGRVRCRITIAWETGRRPCDPDNALAGCKAVFDGLQDTGIFGDDRRLVHEPVEQTRDADGRGYVLVELWGDE